MNTRFLILFFSVIFNTSSAWCQWTFQAEASQAWQSLNDQAVPGNTGTRFSLVDFSRGPFQAYRLYLTRKIDERHEWRILYAPLRIHLTGQLDKAVTFAGQNFSANTDTSAIYQFNSYRFTYSYNMEPFHEWSWALGFTAKIRDAVVQLSQGSLQAKKTNIGFVPLVHLRMQKNITDLWLFRFDMDGLAAPQGRAFDIGLFAEKKLTDHDYSLYAGYRTIEGGANNESVYNFAWLHYLTFGLSKDF